MVSKRRLDDRPIGRRGPTRRPMRRILIVCEGRETERRYFEAFQHEVRNPRVHVHVARETGVPKTVVKHAISLRNEAASEAKRQHDENLQWDEVWGVFDVDDHPSLAEAVELAALHAIFVAVSNPCFELWALLHFQDQQGHIDRHKLRAALQKHMLRYDKVLDFAKMHGTYAEALRRAASLAERAARDNEPGRNPSTGVPRLTESIRSCD
jgi:hypothetical protein